MTLSTNVARLLSYLDSNILILNLVHEFYRNLSVLAAVPHLKVYLPLLKNRPEGWIHFPEIQLGLEWKKGIVK